MRWRVAPVPKAIAKRAAPEEVVRAALIATVGLTWPSFAPSALDSTYKNRAADAAAKGCQPAAQRAAGAHARPQPLGRISATRAAAYAAPGPEGAHKTRPVQG